MDFARSRIHAQRQRFLHLAIPQLAQKNPAPCESAAPATKSILGLAKVLRLPRNSNLAKPARGRANGPVSETVPGPSRTRLRTGVAAEVVCALSGSPIHAQRQRFCILLSPSSPDFRICRSIFAKSYLSVTLTIFWKAIYVSSYLSLPYMSKQLAHLVPVLRKFLVKLHLMNTYLPLYFTIYVSIYIFLYLPVSLYLHISLSLNIHISLSLSLPIPISLYLFV